MLINVKLYMLFFKRVLNGILRNVLLVIVLDCVCYCFYIYFIFINVYLFLL